MSPSLVKMNKMVFVLGQLSLLAVPTGLAGMSIWNRCKPPLIGSLLSCQTSHSHWVSYGVEFVITLKVTTGAFHYISFSLLMITILWGNCQRFLKPPRNLEAFRQSQVEERVLNACFRGRVLPMEVLVAPLLQIFIGVAVITLFHTAHWIVVSVLVILFVDAVVLVLIPLSAGSVIYSRTQDWIKGVQCGNGNKYLRRVARSLRPLRLEFGGNYLDTLTPLIVEEFCWRQTASLLLLMDSVASHK